MEDEGVVRPLFWVLGVGAGGGGQCGLDVLAGAGAFLQRSSCSAERRIYVQHLDSFRIEDLVLMEIGCGVDYFGAI